MAENSRMKEFKANKTIVGNKAVRTFAKQRLRLRNQVFTSFVQSYVVMIWLLTLAGLPRAGWNSKTRPYEKLAQKCIIFREHWLYLNFSKYFRPEKRIKFFLPDSTNQPRGTQRPSKEQTHKDLPHRKRDRKNTWKLWKLQDETMGTFARLELRSQVFVKSSFV